MSEKPTFGRESPDLPEKPKPKKKELAAIWEKLDKNGNKYISVKIKLKNGEELNFKAFKNPYKQQGDTKPTYIAYKE